MTTTLTQAGAASKAALASYSQFVQALYELKPHQIMQMRRWWIACDREVVGDLADEAEAAAYESGRISSDHRVNGIDDPVLNDVQRLFDAHDGLGAPPALAILTRDLIGEAAYQQLTGWAQGRQSEPRDIVRARMPAHTDPKPVAARKAWSPVIALFSGLAVPVSIFVSGWLAQRNLVAGVAMLLTAPLALTVIAFIAAKMRRSVL